MFIDIYELSIDISEPSARLYEGEASAGIEAVIEIVVIGTLDNSSCYCSAAIAAAAIAITSESRRI